MGLFLFIYFYLYTLVIFQMNGNTKNKKTPKLILGLRPTLLENEKVQLQKLL
ncbi:hypothetical protein FEDK69T_25690 [Flavobacterium enshiense DK69]|nr:hypothetical protein FEDK69T_25690 [Flavobacterium enshiense DK69]